MYETNRVPDMWIPRLKRMDEIWVPTHWAKEIFESEIGTESDVRVVVIPEAVDTTFFDPSKSEESSNEDVYTFLSVFKFETRKIGKIFWKDFSQNSIRVRTYVLFSIDERVSQRTMRER